MLDWDFLLRVAGPLAMLGIAWKAISVLEREVTSLRHTRHRHAQLLTHLYAHLEIDPPPSDSEG